MLKKRLKKWFQAITKRNKLAAQTYKNYCYSLEAAASKKIDDLINEIFDLLLGSKINWKSSQGRRASYIGIIILFLGDCLIPKKTKQDVKNLEILLTLMHQISQELVKNNHNSDIDEIIDLMYSIASTDAENFGFDDYDDDDIDLYNPFKSFNEIYNLFYVIINDWKKVKQISPLKTWNALAFSFYYNLDAPAPLHDYDAPAISSSFCDIVYGRKKIEQLYILEPVSFVIVDKNHKGRVVVKIDN